MSTTYPPRLIRYALSSKKQRNAAKASDMAPSFYGHFPPSFSLYYVQPGKDFLSQNFHLETVHTEDAEGQRKVLYAVTFHKGPGSRQLTIYSTTEHGSTPMAIASNKSRWGSSVTLTLPGEEGNARRTEQLRYNGMGSNSHTFELNGESFELQEDSSKKPILRRLVRLGRRDSAAKPASSHHEERDEIGLVATWREGSMPNRDGRLATFEFVSSDVMQELGDYWALFAVTAMLAVFQQGPSLEGTLAWHEEKKLEKGYQARQNAG